MSRYYDDELYHYGVKGMKWGEHIFSKELRTDNRKAFKLGRQATVYDRAERIAKNKVAKRQAAYDKALRSDPTKSKKSTLKKEKALDNIKKTHADAARLKKGTRLLADKHQAQLISKYGEDRVVKMKTDKRGLLNERVANASELISATAWSLGISATMTEVIHFPFVYVVSPESADTKANRWVNQQEFDYGHPKYKKYYGKRDFNGGKSTLETL